MPNDLFLASESKPCSQPCEPPSAHLSVQPTSAKGSSSSLSPASVTEDVSFGWTSDDQVKLNTERYYYFRFSTNAMTFTKIIVIRGPLWTNEFFPLSDLTFSSRCPSASALTRSKNIWTLKFYTPGSQSVSGLLFTSAVFVLSSGAFALCPGCVFGGERLWLPLHRGEQQCGGLAEHQPLSQGLWVLKRSAGRYADLADNCIHSDRSHRERRPPGASKHKQSSPKPTCTLFSEHALPTLKCTVPVLRTASRGTSSQPCGHSAQS